ncbi:MAG: GspE/PulE family protein [bacterium]|nr:GspE/PulE family protein [bacterium]
MTDITGQITISSSRLSEIKKAAENLLEFKKAIEQSLSEKATQLIELIFGGSLILNASDIHFEPEEEKTRIRLRIDGMLYDAAALSEEIYNVLLSRIKLLSGLKLNISDRPQDGRFSINIDGSAIEIRTSTLPAEKGEAAVLRILNPKSLIGVESLGLREDLSEIIEREIKKPNGMIIVTGPTGSGKTTTLYAFLKKIQNPEIKIITIEDPIEYHLQGVSQTQVQPDKGYDFASGLKSIVRQDPDVILVGEIRDVETVNIALQAALTGHLVFTTLHTNDAAGTIARLISLGAKPSNIGPAVNLTIAQRLVRKVCDKCVSLVKISAEDLQKLNKELKSLPKTIKAAKLTLSSKIPKANGCKYCNSTGYKGRLGIYESFLIDDEIEKFIIKEPSIAALKEMAVKKGMVTMKQDGFIKVLKNSTTIEEVERVMGE